MCRWFAYISPKEPALLEDVLITPDHSLTKQINQRYLPGLGTTVKDTAYEHDSRYNPAVGKGDQLFNMDGIGMAWYVSTRSYYKMWYEQQLPALYKSANPASNDFNLANLCGNTESKCIAAHIRAGSESAVAPINNHPFMFGRYVFMHNGVVNQFSKLRRKFAEVLPYNVYKNIQGSTDSEHCAALFITNLLGQNHSTDAWTVEEKSLDEMRKALTDTVNQIHQIQFDMAKEDQEFADDLMANGLNFYVTDGVKCVALRFCNSWVEFPAALYYSTTAGKILKRRAPQSRNALYSAGPDAAPPEFTENEAVFPEHLIIASEPTTYNLLEDGTPDPENPNWTLIVANSLVTMDSDGKTVTKIVWSFKPEFMLNKGVAP